MQTKCVEEVYNFGRFKRIYTVKEEGEMFERDEKGNLFSNYKRFLDGEFKEFDSCGNLLHESTYSQGKLQGKFIGYHKDGKVWYELNYIDGKIVN